MGLEAPPLCVHDALLVLCSWRGFVSSSVHTPRDWSFATPSQALLDMKGDTKGLGGNAEPLTLGMLERLERLVKV